MLSHRQNAEFLNRSYSFPLINDDERCLKLFDGVSTRCMKVPNPCFSFHKPLILASDNGK